MNIDREFTVFENDMDWRKRKRLQFLEPDDVMLIRAMAEVNPTAELLGLLKFASDRQIGRTQRNI